MPQSATSTGKPAARRRPCRLLGLALVLLTLALTLPVGTSASISSGHGGWFKQISGATAELRAVAFSDATHGWAVGGAYVPAGGAGSGGAILATTDGGANWSTQTSATIFDLLGVTFTDAEHGWAVVTYAATLVTTNGGVTWSEESIETGAGRT